MGRGPGRTTSAGLAVGALALVGVLAVGCGGGTAKSGPATATSGSATSRPAPSTGTEPSAASDLAAFVSSAGTVDRRLRAAAAAVNGGITADLLTITQPTRDAIATADPAAAAATIPAGLGPDLMRTVLLVQSDLVARSWALRGFERAFEPTGTATVARSDPNAEEAMRCLGNGSAAAADFAADLLRVRSAAAAAPPVPAVAPDSRAAGDLAVWLRTVNLRNSGCGSCGGQRMASLPPITWGETGPQFPGDLDWNGDIDGVAFHATFVAGQGWTVVLRAC